MLRDVQRLYSGRSSTVAFSAIGATLVQVPSWRLLSPFCYKCETRSRGTADAIDLAEEQDEVVPTDESLAHNSFQTI